VALRALARGPECLHRAGASRQPAAQLISVDEDGLPVEQLDYKLRSTAQALGISGPGQAGTTKIK